MTRKQIYNQTIALSFSQKYMEDIIFCEETKTFHIYNQDLKYFEMKSKQKIRTLIFEFINEHYKTPITNARLKDIIKLLEITIHRRVETIFNPYIAFKDVLLNTKTFVNEKHDKLNKPCFFNIPYLLQDISKAPKPERFLQFLDEVLINKKTEEPDKVLQTTMQEITGFLLQNSLKGYVSIFLSGSGYNGKSIMLSIFEELIGSQNITAMTLSQLTTNEFTTSNLVGKKLNLVGEEESKYLKSDNFKRLCDGTVITTAKKFGDHFNFIPRCKFVFATNKQPSFTEVNKGIRRRLMFIPFFADFEGRDDKNLKEKIMSEFLGIIRWAIIGGKKFVENKHLFTISKQSKKMEKSFLNSASSTINFISDNFKFDKTQSHYQIKIYKCYQEWCILVGRKSQSFQSFIRDITHIYPKWIGNNHIKITFDEDYALEELKSRFNI